MISRQKSSRQAVLLSKGTISQLWRTLDISKARKAKAKLDSRYRGEEDLINPKVTLTLKAGSNGVPRMQGAMETDFRCHPV